MQQPDSPTGQHMGGIVNYFQGATIHNIVINGNMTRSGKEYYNSAENKQTYTDEQITKAITACVGDDKVINNMRKWAGVYWCLRWKCNYPVDIREFCFRIESLMLNLPDSLKCDYNNIRKFCKLSFMEYDPFSRAEVKVSNMDKEVYAWCREVALKVGEELGKTYLPEE